MFTTESIAGESDDCVKLPVVNERTFDESTHGLSDELKVISRQSRHFINCRTGGFCRRRRRCTGRTGSNFTLYLRADPARVVDPVFATVASCLVGRVGLRTGRVGVQGRLDDDLRHRDASFNLGPAEFTDVQMQQPLCVPRGG